MGLVLVGGLQRSRYFFVCLFVNTLFYMFVKLSFGFASVLCAHFCRLIVWLGYAFGFIDWATASQIRSAPYLIQQNVIVTLIGSQSSSRMLSRFFFSSSSLSLWDCSLLYTGLFMPTVIDDYCHTISTDNEASLSLYVRMIFLFLLSII